MDEHRDIYTKPEPRAEEPKNLPAYDLAPEDARAHGRKRSIYSISIMVVLLSLAAFYFYSQESGFDTNPLAELLRGPARSTGQVARAASTNRLPPLAGLGAEFDLESGQSGAANIAPQKMAEAMGYLRIANQHLMQRDLDGAENNVKLALDIWPDMNAANRLLGVVYIYRGQHDQAILILERALQTDPFSAETLNNLATAYLQKGQMDKAEDLLLTSMQIRADSLTTHVNLGLLYILWARYDQAVEYLETALQLMPEQVSVRNNLGVSLMRVGRFAEARKHFQNLVDREPTRAAPYFNMAIAYALEQNHTEALNWARQAVQRCSPQDAQRHLMDSDFDGLRGQPEFQNLVRSLSQPIALPPGPTPRP